MPQTAFASDGPRHVLAETTRTGELVPIVLKNTAMKLLTLGVYQFWSTANVRRYLWSCVRLDGDPVEWTGTGKELFKGFVAVLLFILLPLAVLNGLAHSLAQNGHPGLGGTAAFVINLTYLSLVPLGLYRARRYRLSRTVWRGIRGTQVGSAWRYVALWWTWNILLVFTLGLTWPLRSAALMRYKLRNTVFGDHCFHSDASGKRLYKPFLVAVVLLLGIGGLTVFFAVKLGGSALSRHEAAAPWIIGLFVFAGLLAAISTWAGYRAAELRHFTETASWGNLEFRTGIGSEGVIRVMVPNFLLTLFTLGLGLPFAQMRSLRAVARYLVIVGEQNFDEVAQNPARPPGSGEGLVAIFDGVDI